MIHKQPAKQQVDIKYFHDQYVKSFSSQNTYIYDLREQEIIDISSFVPWERLFESAPAELTDDNRANILIDRLDFSRRNWKPIGNAS